MSDDGRSVAVFRAEDFIRPNQYGDAVVLIAEMDAGAANARLAKLAEALERLRQRALAPARLATVDAVLAAWEELRKGNG